MVYALAVLGFVWSVLAGAGAAQADIDHCVTNERNFLRNLCEFRISVRYCCYGSEWYACDHSAKIGWGKDPGYHEWLSPGEKATMACDPDVAGWRWAGCRVPDDSYELAPYGWDMQSARGLRCTQDGDPGTPQARDNSGASQAQDSAGAPQDRDRSGDGLAGRWIKYNEAAAAFHDDLLAACVVEMLDCLSAEGSAWDAVHAEWVRRSILLGREVELTGSVAMRGRVEGFETDGALRLRDAAGDLRRVRSGDVSLRLVTDDEPPRP